MSETSRTVLLVACWGTYASFPIVFNVFDARHVDDLYWESVLRHALAILGYGTIGCWLYAFTGRKGLDHRGFPHPGRFERLCLATLVSVMLFVLALFFDYGP